MAEIEIHRNDDAGRYELSVGGELATIADFHDEDERRVFPNTVTSPRFRGNGYAAKLVRTALEDAADEERQVVPSCWFVAEYIDDHTEYQALVAD